eukprot:TRINITY_DN38359_c0_g1_i1.p1 TRINITY_DN38359_c0_g1~~TRINITY_DN38359_c0_g1_i1.p1  ORF type:complete len:523 (+),score=30.35 TRINITY_DN38359_c0_g1_i1:328-1896(+)
MVSDVMASAWQCSARPMGLQCISRIQDCMCILALLASYAIFTSASLPAPIRIDCGSNTTAVDTLYVTKWIADAYAVSGVSVNLTNANVSTTPEMATLRYFPNGDSPCYDVPVADGRYLVRLGFLYDNYDNLDTPPSFYVAINGVKVDYVSMGAAIASDGSVPVYGDYYVFANSSVNVCFPVSIGVPFINSLEVLAVVPSAYEASRFSSGVVLSKLVGINGGGPEVTEKSDGGYRRWGADTTGSSNASFLSVSNTILIDGLVTADTLPGTIFRTAREGTAALGNATGWVVITQPLSTALGGTTSTWYLRMYFCELVPEAKGGDRVMDLFVEANSNVRVFNASYDILGSGTPVLKATYASYLFELSSTTGTVTFVFGAIKASESLWQPIINGVEVFEVIGDTGPTVTKVHRSAAYWTFLILLILAIVLAIVAAVFLTVWCVQRQRAQQQAEQQPWGQGISQSFSGGASRVSNWWTRMRGGGGPAAHPEELRGVSAYERSSQGLFSQGAQDGNDGFDHIELSGRR